MKLCEISPKDGYRLFLRYDDGACGEVDLSSYAGRGVFTAWLQPGVFEQVTLAEAGYPEWPGEIDLCPDALYMQLTGKSPEEVFPTLRKLPVHA
jgi:Protein of unknown function (DUF2442)